MIAQHIRNRTNAFQAILNLQTERKWCLTGTPVQNSLDDLFTLTEFLQYHPVENRQNARRWILDPLGAKEDQAIENLRLLMGSVALRRTRNIEMKHSRSDIEVTVILSHTERQQYDSIRSEARRMITCAEKKTFAHKLLFYILQMRQVCSHGLRGRASAARGLLPSNTVCNKCSEILTGDTVLDASMAADGETQYCLECAAEESSSLGVDSDSSSLQNLTCQNTGSPQSCTDVDMLDVHGNGDDNGIVMLDETAVSRPEGSSKVDSVVNNLLQLEKNSCQNSTPIKR